MLIITNDKGICMWAFVILFYLDVLNYSQFVLNYSQQNEKFNNSHKQ